MPGRVEEYMEKNLFRRENTKSVLVTSISSKLIPYVPFY